MHNVYKYIDVYFHMYIRWSYQTSKNMFSGASNGLKYVYINKNKHLNIYSIFIPVCQYLPGGQTVKYTHIAFVKRNNNLQLCGKQLSRPDSLGISFKKKKWVGI